MYGVFFYLASPYSKFPGGIEEAFNAACYNAALLVAEGVPIFSPIAHTHPIAVAGNLDPLDHKIWLPADRPFIQLAHGLIVLEMEGWRESVGVAHEIEAFRTALKPIVPMTPGVIPHALLVRAAGQRSVLGS